MSDDPGVLYFGCWLRAGHFFFIPGPDGPRSAPVRDWGDWRPPYLPWEKVDGALTPGKRDSRGRLEVLSRSPQGDAAIHWRDGWTALAVHDYTVDSRGGSNSVFFFRDLLDFDEAVANAREWFPQVVARIGEIREAR